MKRERIELEIVTPCFLRGAQQTAEWRAASIRGQLRWWFRAVAGAAYEGDLQKVRDAEDLLFGSTDRSSLLRIRTSPTPAAVPGSTHFPLGPSLTAAEIANLWGERNEATLRRLRLDRDGSRPVHYLGFGPIVGNQLERPYLPPETPVHFEILWMRDLEDSNLRLFDQALWAWLHLGGIGGRSRRGFGSLQKKPFPGDRKAFIEQARALLKLGREAGRLSTEWTCFNAGSRILVSREACRSWSEAMTWLGAWLIAFRRRYGYPADSRPGLANRDYAWAAPKGHLRRDPKREVPDRAGFGLPIHFGKLETVTWDASDKEGDARRASPLLLHVARLGPSSFLPVLTYLPSTFLPAGKRLRFKKPPGKPQIPTSNQLGIVDRFLDDLVGKKKIEEVA